MNTSEKKYEKILFKYHSNILDELTSETMWAELIDKNKGIYKLDNIPFYGPEIATDDEFYAEFDDSEQILTYIRTTKQSGNSIVLVIVLKKEFNREIIRNHFKELNCDSEGINNNYFSMEILKKTDYSKIRKILDEYQDKGIIDFAEPCLSEKHKNELKNN